jgi:glycerol uptake facilitator-like aquaporin
VLVSLGFVCFYLVEKNILYLVKNFILLNYINHNNNPITNTMLNKYVVEFLGTLFFLYVIVATGNAIAIGAALAIAIMVGGSISGGHFNPAVTIMMYAAGKLSRSDLIPYLIVQIAGGLVALELYKRFKF